MRGALLVLQIAVGLTLVVVMRRRVRSRSSGSSSGTLTRMIPAAIVGTVVLAIAATNSNAAVIYGAPLVVIAAIYLYAVWLRRRP